MILTVPMIFVDGKVKLQLLLDAGRRMKMREREKKNCCIQLSEIFFNASIYSYPALLFLSPWSVASSFGLNTQLHRRGSSIGRESGK